MKPQFGDWTLLFYVPKPPVSASVLCSGSLEAANEERTSFTNSSLKVLVNRAVGFTTKLIKGCLLVSPCPKFSSFLPKRKNKTYKHQGFECLVIFFFPCRNAVIHNESRKSRAL